MKKILLPTLSLLLFFSNCDMRKKENQTNLNNKGEKKIVQNPTTVQVIDTTYDFGKVKEGEIVEYNFRFKNTGLNPLVIEDAVASCGCTVPEKPDQPIAPGELGFIKVKFNSEHRPGQSHKSITITSTAVPEFPTLYLMGTVIGKETN
jgi:hypothetical protein